MKILIIGGDGMLGHQLLKTLQVHHEVKVTLRKDLAAYQHYGLFHAGNSYPQIDVSCIEDLISVIGDFHPQAVVNAAGIVKQRRDANEIIPSLEINALFPHRLALLCKIAQARLIHLSTDCVFSGNKGQYTEDDPSDAEDVYGKSKYLGEVHEPHCVTIRSSIIGLQLSRKSALIEWFLAQRGVIKGYVRAIYTGFPTVEMSRVIEKILLEFPELSGLWQVAAPAINKYELLSTFARLINKKDVQIIPDEGFFCDRSLVAKRFLAATGYQTPSWQELLSELAEQVEKREKKILCY